MISIEESFPKRNVNGLHAQDILWTQFNDVNFYVEDVDQQNFYLYLLKKLFPDIRISRIFPLGGKSNVINAAKKSRSKKKIFLLDLDFDEILNKKVNKTNIFYLNKYSIENYLLDEKGIIELVKEENPKLTDLKIRTRLNFSEFKKECLSLFGELSCNFLLIHKFELGLDYLKIEPNRDCHFDDKNCCIKSAVINQFFGQVATSLAIKKPGAKYQNQVKLHMKYFNSVERCLTNAPGKYLINFLILKLKKLFQFSQTRTEVFIYRLMKNCGFEKLEYLKVAVMNYMSPVSN